MTFPKTVKKVLDAADRWARNIMRTDIMLDKEEQSLLEAVSEYIKENKKIETGNFIDLPKPPNIPKDFKFKNRQNEDTVRYSKYPTRPIIHTQPGFPKAPVPQVSPPSPPKSTPPTTSSNKSYVEEELDEEQKEIIKRWEKIINGDN